LKKNKTCRKGFHNWIEADADIWTITVCRTCKVDWDFDNLAWWEKVKWEIEDIIAHRQAKKFVKKNWEAPF
tara:strand:- start:6890 stop:7102 length:213 start_codon:yes stop_codon:yes gene_type:complete